MKPSATTNCAAFRYGLARAFTLFALGWAACAAQAGEHRFQVLLDTDNNGLSGCTVTTAKGAAPGIEQVWTTVVTTTPSGATVTRIERQTCSGVSLGAPTTFATAGWSAGLGNGTAGTAALETYVPLAQLPSQGAMNVRVASTNATGGQDATSAFLISLGPVPPGPSGAQAIPLSPWLVPPLALVLLVLTGFWARRHPEQLSLFGCILLITVSGLAWAAAVILDGNVADWNGIASVAGNAKGSAPVDANIVGVFYQSDTANLYFRIDADVRPDAPPGNQAPVVAAGADQVIVLPASATLTGSASDDGLPNPPGALTLTWTVVTGPALVSFADAAAASTTATFTLPGL